MLVSCTTPNFVSYGTAKSKGAVLKGVVINREGDTNFNKRTIQTGIRVVYRVHEKLDSSNLCSGLVSLVMFTGGSRSQHIPQ